MTPPPAAHRDGRANGRPAARPAARARLVTVADVEAYDGPPLYLFLGIDTAGSRVHDAFATWAPAFGIPGATLRGIDLPTTTSRPTWRRLVAAMRDNPAVHGGVVTSHKLRLHRACADLFDRAEAFVELTHEVNGLDTRSGVSVVARDVEALDLTLRSTGVARPADSTHPTTGTHRTAHGTGPAGRPLVCLGAGGAATALLLATRLDVARTLESGGPVPVTDASAIAPLVVVDREPGALRALAAVAERAHLGAAPVLTEADSPERCARVVRDAPRAALVINATGLGKSGPGSPLPDAAAFRAGQAAWDLNYRGPLTFLAQARAAGIPTADGWDYFLAGWSCALGAITGTDPRTALTRVSAVTHR